MTTAAETSIPPWVEKAARLPVAFAQVREDPRVDLAVLDRVGGAGRRVLMIASGGCTAAALAASGRVGRLDLVDANPAQIALTRLKLHLLRTAVPDRRRELLGHRWFGRVQRAALLAAGLTELGLPPDVLGPPELIAVLGPDGKGRYEVLFRRLRRELGGNGRELASVVRLRDPAEQSRRVASGTPLGDALDAAFDRVMALPNLVRLFGASATQNAREPFARHFAARVRHALATFPAADNPFLWQMLVGRFPGGVAYDWLDARPPAAMPEVTEYCGTMDAALAGADEGSYDFVHLSNILDWLTPAQAARTLELTFRALRPGGMTLIRQLNSALDVPSLGGRFEWLAGDAADLHARDRSFFYHALHLGRRP